MTVGWQDGPLKLMVQMVIQPNKTLESIYIRVYFKSIDGSIKNQMTGIPNQSFGPVVDVFIWIRIYKRGLFQKSQDVNISIAQIRY